MVLWSMPYSFPLSLCLSSEMKKVAVLGSTGSIGTQTLDVVRQFPEKLKIVSLVAYSNKELLNKQADEFHPEFTALISVSGAECLTKAVQSCDVAVVATRGIVALNAVLWCLRNGKDVALANKEVLVCGGELVMAQAFGIGNLAANDTDPITQGRCSGLHGRIFPVDSEHCAVWQCLLGHNKIDIDKLLLTASGGPFWNVPVDRLRFVKPADALCHPNWSMGTKITVDSATFMNKVLEVIEAHFLYDVPPENVKIVVHRQSIVHSMVQFKSGSVIAQLAKPNMRLPIQLALLGESNRIVKNVDFETLLTLTFEGCDFVKFPCARFSHEIWNYPPLCRTVMNGANDVCVESFLNGAIDFGDFYPTIAAALKHFAPQTHGVPVTVENIRRFDTLSKEYVVGLLANKPRTI